MISDVVSTIFLYGIILVLGILVVLSLIVRDYKFIVENTTDFVFELIMFALVSSILVSWVLYETRKLSKQYTFWLFISLFIKFAIFHVVCQLSGIYTSLFKK
jgi:prolipoprotein diacylglyceryltransferase